MGNQIRPPSFVKQDFRDRGILIRWLSRRRLSYFPDEAYSAVLGRVDGISKRCEVRRFKIDPIGKVSPATFKEIPDEILEEKFLKGKMSNVLDLRGIEVFWQSRKAEAAKESYLARDGSAVAAKVRLPFEDSVRQLMEIIALERKYFQGLIGKPGVTAEKLFKALAHGLERFKVLGFHATVLRPIDEEGTSLEKCRWRDFYRAEKWGEETYSMPEGNVPQDTLLSVIRSRMTRFKVDLSDLSSFSQQGLECDPEKIKHIKATSRGASEVLIYRLESMAQSPEAVIYISNMVSRESFERPPHYLFSPGDEALIIEALNLYFDEVAQAFNIVRKRAGWEQAPSVGSMPLSPTERNAFLTAGQKIAYRDQRIRLFEVPLEKFYSSMDGVVDWLRDTILEVYEGTKIAEGKSKEELIKVLSLEEGKMRERVIYARYLALIEGDPPNQHILKGVVSGTVLDINDGGPGTVFKVPEAMIKKLARGRKLEVALSYEMVLRVFRKRWAEMGFIKGFFHMLRQGIPFYATTQSLRVARDMLRLKDLSLLRLVGGKQLSAEQKKIIDVGSAGKADERGIERNAYGGRIAISEEEKEIILREPHWIFSLPVLGPFLKHFPLIALFFKRHHGKIEKENEKIKRLFADELGEKGKIHLVGYFTVGVALKVGFELAFTRFLRWFS